MEGSNYLLQITTLINNGFSWFKLLFKKKKFKDNVPGWGWTRPAYCLFNCSLYYTFFYTFSFFTFHFTSLYVSHFSFTSRTFSHFSLWGHFWVVITLVAQESKVTCHSYTRMEYWQCVGLELPTLWLQDQYNNYYTILSPR